LTSQTYWQIALTGIKVNAQETTGCSTTAPCGAIVDTGTSLIIGPAAGGANNLIAAVGQVPANCQGVNNLPTITFSLNGQLLSLPPSVYVLNQGGQCFLGIQASTTLNFWILGDSFMRNYFTVFDRGTNQVGFAALAGQTPLANGAPAPAPGEPFPSLPPPPSVPPVAAPVVQSVNAKATTTNTPVIIGVVIGVFGFLIIVIVVFFVVRRRMGTRTSTYPQNSSYSPRNDAPITAPSYVQPSYPQSAYVPAQPSYPAAQHTAAQPYYPQPSIGSSIGIGAPVIATYSGDGRQYRAVVADKRPGYYLVKYPEFGTAQEWLPVSAVRSM